MADVKTHYDNLLAPYYSWIYGGVEGKLAENRKFFRNHGLRPALSGVAMDLGAGCGFQSIPLAESGFRVIAIDICRDLLTDLEKSAGELPIETFEDNLLNFSEHHPANTELIVCMGDTLTHLDSLETVQGLFKNIYQTLESNGRLVLSFRDLTFELKDQDRFIPVRSQSNLIFTCFLEYEKDHVKVHDIIYEKTNDQWHLKKGFYRKLRIPPDWTKACLLKTGFKVEEFEIQNGMVTVTARKG
jgi:SAM-dependent methyltransferase